MRELRIIPFCLMMLISISSFYFTSCSDDVVEEMEEELNDTTITATDLITSVKEVKEGTISEILSIGTVSANTNFGTLSYSIKSQTPQDAISINTATGAISSNTISVFDFETNTEVNAVVTLKAGTISKDVNVKITIENVAETISFSGGATAMPIINENSATDFVLTTVTANTDFGDINYSIEANDYIQVDASTGEVTFKDDAVLDYEAITAGGASNSFEFDVTATNATDASLTAERAIRFSINDVEGVDEVEERFNAGQTPAQIVAANASLQSDLYGRNYRGGVIATFDANTGGGLIITPNSINNNGVTWSQANAYVGNYSNEGYSDWRLPTDAEMTLICANSSSFVNGDYQFFWGKDNCGGICYKSYALSTNDACSTGGSPNFSQQQNVRAIRSY